MSYEYKGNKLGKMELSDEHLILSFPVEDRRYIQSTYTDNLVFYNNMVDEILEELTQNKKEIDKMVHYTDNKKMVWSYRHVTASKAARFYQNFTRLERDLDNILDERRQLMTRFHENAMRYHNDQTPKEAEFEPMDSAEKQDLIPSVGINKVAQQVTNETFKRWEFFEFGRSLIEAEFDNDKLEDPIMRFYIKSHGALSAIGDIIRMLVISPDDMPDDDIGEVAVFNSITSGDMLFRSVLKKLVHHDATNFLATSSNIYLVSRR